MTPTLAVVSVNVGIASPLRIGRRDVATGIDKRPATGRVRVHRLGLDGDAIVSTRHHGGPDQAVYVYGTADYAFFEAELGLALPPGTFGENLTLAELASGEIRIGDRLRVGDEVVLEVTAPRIPCSTLTARMGDKDFPERFRAAERPGLYCRVIDEGEVGAGDTVELTAYQGQPLTMAEAMRLFYDRGAPASAFERALATPAAIRARRDWQRRLVRARA